METTIATTEQEVIARKREAWSNLAEAVHTTELQLQAMAQKAIAGIKLPESINDIPPAEESLKTLKATMAEVEDKRKVITNKFRDVADRLMLPEKSFAEPIKKLTEAIVSLKKAYEAEQQKEMNKQNEIRLLRESVAKWCAELDAKLKLYINELIDKAFVFALHKPIILADVNKYIDDCSKNGVLKIMEYKFDAFKLNPQYITMDEATAIVKEGNTIDLVDYANTFDWHIKEKFKGYEVAFLNKADALKQNEIQKQEAAKKIADEKLNSEIAASLNSASQAHTPVVGIETKQLKKVYEVDMIETVDTALMLFAAFVSHKEECMKQLRVTKWWSMNASQIANALGKIKSADERFAPAGIKFKEVEKL